MKISSEPPSRLYVWGFLKVEIDSEIEAECTKIARFSAAAAAISTAPQRIAIF